MGRYDKGYVRPPTALDPSRGVGRPGKAAIEKEREVYEKSLFDFAKLLNPHYMYGDIHEKVFKWLSSKSANDHQLLLMPRGHLKSHCIAVWCVWQITRDPTTTIVYLSASDELAKIQIYAIKNMITCHEYRRLWPEMINQDEGKREKWAADGFSVDHPNRKRMGIRDRTIIVKTVKSNAVGLHCSHLILDDVVVPKFAHTATGRRELSLAISYYASIKNPGAKTKAVGTIYDPLDLYHDFLEARTQKWNEEKECFGEEEPLWDVKMYVVEDKGDGTGTFLWPREQNPADRKDYGFDIATLASIRNQYFSTGKQAEYYSQYYNQANDPSSHKVDKDDVQYYNPKHLIFNGKWEYNNNPLNIYAAMDIAWSTDKHADYTAVVVIGIDAESNVYVLDVDRFKTADYNEYYKHVLALHHEWAFNRLKIETNAGGYLVANELKRLARQNGTHLSIDAKHTSGSRGSKTERMDSLLIPRIKNGGVWFRRGGLTPILIEEIMLERPPHDDMKDALTEAINIAHPPGKKGDVAKMKNKNKIIYHNRFGGRVSVSR